jgi:homoserine O-acetyltransferase
MTEQRDLAAHIPNAGFRLVIIPSPDGHDGFWLEFEQINARHLWRLLRQEFLLLYEGDVSDLQTAEGFDIMKTSIFREAEADIARW